MLKRAHADIARLIVGTMKPRNPMVEGEGPDDMLDDDEGDSHDDLSLIAGDVLDAIKNDDEEAFAEALQAFVASCAGGR
jgi:hypothetical protein